MLYILYVHSSEYSSLGSFRSSLTSSLHSVSHFCCFPTKLLLLLATNPFISTVTYIVRLQSSETLNGRSCPPCSISSASPHRNTRTQTSPPRCTFNNTHRAHNSTFYITSKRCISRRKNRKQEGKPQTSKMYRILETGRGNNHKNVPRIAEPKLCGICNM